MSPRAALLALSRTSLLGGRCRLAIRSHPRARRDHLPLAPHITSPRLRPGRIFPSGVTCRRARSSGAADVDPERSQIAPVSVRVQKPRQQTPPPARVGAQLVEHGAVIAVALTHSHQPGTSFLGVGAPARDPCPERRAEPGRQSLAEKTLGGHQIGTAGIAVAGAIEGVPDLFPVDLAIRNRARSLKFRSDTRPNQ